MTVMRHSHRSSINTFRSIAMRDERRGDERRRDERRRDERRDDERKSRSEPVPSAKPPVFLDYQVVQAGSIEELQRLVYQQLARGWEPVGGFGTLSMPGLYTLFNSVYYQAMALRA